jgi:hypothetical protein
MGKSFHKLTATVVTVGPGAAADIRKKCHYARQRNFSERNLRRLSAELSAGRFIDGTPLFFVRLPDGRVFLVNGNHTLEAIIRSGVYQRLVMIVLDVDSEEEVARIYGTMDVHKARTWADALRAVGLADEITNAARVMPALGVIMNRFEFVGNNVEVTASRAVRFDLMSHYGDESAMVQAALAGAPLNNQRAVQRAAVLAVALECMKYQPGAGLEFWRGLAQDDGLSKNDPRKALLRWLHSNNVTAGNGAWPQQSRACAHAWNAFMKGATLTVIRKSEAAGMVIAGTPWAGKGNIPPLIAKAIADAAPAPLPEAPVEDQAPPASSSPADLFDIGLFAKPPESPDSAHPKA